jgi:hypothetical protein
MPALTWPSENMTALLPSTVATIQSTSDQSSNNGTDTITIFLNADIRAPKIGFRAPFA